MVTKVIIEVPTDADYAVVTKTFHKGVPVLAGLMRAGERTEMYLKEGVGIVSIEIKGA